MKMKAGSVAVNRDIESVYGFISRAENLHKQIPDRGLDAYQVALEHGLQGPLRSGHQLSVCVTSARRERKDYVIDVEVSKLVENRHMEMKMVGARVHHTSRGDITEELPIRKIVGRLGMVIQVHPDNDGTLITLWIKVEPSRLLFKPTEFMLMKIVAFKSRGYLSVWAAHIEASV